MMLEYHVPLALEVYYQTNEEMIKKGPKLNNPYQGELKLDLMQLCDSFGSVAEFHWRHGIARLALLPNDYVAQKKIFHAIRILDYGIQIALESTICDTLG